MKQKMFTIYDSKAFAYLPPFFIHREEMAQRAFGEACNSPTHQFGKFPADYTLFKIGVFDDETAVLVSFAPENLGNGLTFLKPQNADNLELFPEVESLKKDGEFNERLQKDGHKWVDGN